MCICLLVCAFTFVCECLYLGVCDLFIYVSGVSVRVCMCDYLAERFCDDFISLPS
jgi:hypothetical protein